MATTTTMLVKKNPLLMLTTPPHAAHRMAAMPLVVLSRRGIYQYLTKDRKEYEAYKARTKRYPQWVKEGPEMPMKSIQVGHGDDPEFWGTMNAMYLGSPRFDGFKLKEFYYREVPPHMYDPPFLDRFMVTICTSFFWFWLCYMFYWKPYKLFGHHYVPYVYEFSDEELGIPPDDAEDPPLDQYYWGHHNKAYRSYR